MYIISLFLPPAVWDMHLVLTICFCQYNLNLSTGHWNLLYAINEADQYHPRYGNLFCVAQSISHIVNATVA